MRDAMPPSGDDEPSPFTEIDQAFDRASNAAAEDECIPPETTAPRTVLLSATFALAVLLLAAVIGYTSSLFAVGRAAEHTDERVAVLENDLRQRRATAAEQNANRDKQIAELRKLVCVLADHAQPRDAAVQEVRVQYNCVPPPVSPSPTD